MSTRKWLAGGALLLLVMGSAWATGVDEDDDYRYGGPGGRYYQSDSERESLTLEGTFSLVDGLYPALVTPEGDTWYLMAHINLDDETIPADGSALKVEGLRSPMSPVHLMVLSAEVNGKEIEMDWRGRGPGDKNGGMYGGTYGGRGGMHGGQRGGGRPGGGMYGGGPAPGWGYSDRDN